MIELIDRRRSDDIMNLAVYISVAVHTSAIMFHDNITIYLLPGGNITFRVWGVATMIASAVCLIATFMRSLELERAGLTGLTTAMVAYSMSGFVMVDTESYPGQTTSLLALAMSFVLAHHTLKLTRQIQTNNIVTKMAEKHEYLKKGFIEGAG